MSTDEQAPAETVETPDSPQTEPSESEWKTRAREWEKRAKDNVEAARKLAEIEDRDKTEMQRLLERAEAAEAEKASLLAGRMRDKIARDKGIPDLADLLQGSTEDEIAAHADDVIARIGKLTPDRPPGRPVERLQSGSVATNDQAPADVDAWIRGAVSARAANR